MGSQNKSIMLIELNLLLWIFKWCHLIILQCYDLKKNFIFNKYAKKDSFMYFNTCCQWKSTSLLFCVSTCNTKIFNYIWKCFIILHYLSKLLLFLHNDKNRSKGHHCAWIILATTFFYAHNFLTDVKNTRCRQEITIS